MKCIYEIYIFIIVVIIIDLRKDQEGLGVARDVLRFQNRRCFSLQGAAQAEEEVDHCEFDRDDEDSHNVLFADDDSLCSFRTFSLV